MNIASETMDASVVFVEGVAPHQVVCWTRKTIQPGEELLAASRQTRRFYITNALD
jgi:hypothetical protein